MICKNCGSQLDDGSKFCGNCGTPVANSTNVVDNSVNVDVNQNSIPDSTNNALNQNSVSSDNSINALESSTETVNNVSSVSNNEVLYDEKKSSKLGLLIVFVLLIGIIGVGCYFGYNALFSKERIVSSIIDTVYNKIDAAIDDSYSLNYEKDSVLVNGDFTFNTNIPDLDFLNSEKLSYSIGLDYLNKRMQIGASLSENEDSLLDAMLYLKDNSGYISLDDIYSSLIKISLPEDQFGKLFEVKKTELTKDEMKYINKAFRDNLMNSLDMNDIKKSSKVISLNGVDTKVTDLSYTLNSSNSSEFFNKFIDNMLNDQKLLEIFSKSSDYNVSEISSILTKAKESNSLNSSVSSISFDIYTKGLQNEFVGMDISSDIELSIQIRKYGDNIDFNISNDGLIFNFVIKSLSDNSYSIDYAVTIEDTKVSGNVSISSKVISDTKFESNIVFKINYEDMNFTLYANSAQSVGENIADVDVSNAVLYESITEEEMNEIYSKLLAKFQDSKIYQFIDSYMNGLSDSDYEIDSSVEGSVSIDEEIDADISIDGLSFEY